MPLNGGDLAVEIKDSLGFGSQDTSTKNLNMAANIVAHIQTGIVSFAPGSVTGEAPASGGPLLNGAATGGTITLVPSALQALFIATFGISTPQIIAFAQAISNHIMTGSVEFSSGNITGACTNTTSNPGVLTGVGVDGTISGLDGTALASSIAAALGKPTVSQQVTDMAQAIVDHVMNNASVSLPVVTATCPVNGGDIELGTATGGIIL